MRRLLASTAILCVLVALSACGGGDSASGPLESALSYVPKSTPFVVAVDTDLEGGQYKSLQEILDRFPGGVKVEDLLAGQLNDDGVSFAKDVKPLLGNPSVISATDVASFLSDSSDDFVAALEVKDSEALDRLIDKTKPEEKGEVAGATVYDDGGTVFAVKEDTLVISGSERLLNAALERSEAGEGMDPERFEDALEGLPDEALARVYLDVQALLTEDPDTTEARKIEWVGALRTLGITAALDEDSVDIEFNLKAPGDLTEEDLPLAAGDEAAPVVRQEGEIGVGVREPGQIVTFFESALQVLDPQDSGDYETGKQAISQQLGVDVDDDIFGQLTGNLALSLALDGSFGARMEVESPGAFADTVDKVAEALPQLGSGLGVTSVRQDGDLYEAQLADGGRFFFGMRNDVFVVGSDAARALALATQEPSAIDGAEGSVVMAADAEQVALVVIEQLGGQLGVGGLLGGGLFARPLEDLTGSVSSSTEGMRGSFSLTLD